MAALYASVSLELEPFQRQKLLSSKIAVSLAAAEGLLSGGRLWIVIRYCDRALITE